MDLFGTTGQDRRRWLDSQGNALAEGLRYYLGPSGVDARLNVLAQVAPMFMDGTDYMDAQTASGELFANPSLANALAFAAPMAALAVPGVSNRLAQGLTDVGTDAARFAMDESGALRLFHGSPHDFDKFSMDKIGTGEGAQAYGHGLYFAESEDVARGYRDALAPGMGDGALRAIGISDGDIRTMRQFTQSSVDPDIALRDWLGWTGQRETPELRAAFMQEWNGRNPGRLYEVNVNANPEDFLDWDKPLSEQPQKVRDALTGIYPDDMMGGDIARLMASDSRDAAIMRGDNAATSLGASQSAASESMRGLGIPGIRYLDAGSRGAGDGSRNYVVFDENLITIVKKYGIGGAAAVYGVSEADIANAMGMDAQTGQPVYQPPPRAD